MARSSSTSLRAATSGPRALRLRASGLVKALEPGLSSEAGRIRLRSRESLVLDEHVEIEVGFGAMTDEVVLRGKVCEVGNPRRGPSEVLIVLPRSERERLAYVREVLDGRRTASARRHRRIPVDIDVRWVSKQGQILSRALDLSRGGAFIESRLLPSVGTFIELELRPRHADDDVVTAPVRIGAVVSWIRDSGAEVGFGVNFKLRDRETATRVEDVIRRCEFRG